MQLTYQAADSNVVHLLALFLQKKHIFFFVQPFGWAANWVDLSVWSINLV